MKKWAKQVISRIGRMVIELLSVKTIVATVVTIVYVARSENLGTLGFMSIVFLWCFVVGTRQAMKMKTLLTGVGAAKDKDDGPKPEKVGD